MHGLSRMERRNKFIRHISTAMPESGPGNARGFTAVNF